MPTITASSLGNTVYTRLVAKVMISIPNALLKRVDAYVSTAGESRSGFLQRLAERELERADTVRRARIEGLLDEIDALGPGANAHLDAAQLIREDRESH